MPVSRNLGTSAVKASLTLVDRQSAIETDFILPVPGMRLVNRLLSTGSVSGIRPPKNDNIRYVVVEGSLTLLVGAPFSADTCNVDFGENGDGQPQFIGAIFCS